MNSAFQFSVDTSPAIVMLDVSGRKNPVRRGYDAAEAIGLADELQLISGNGRVMTSHLVQIPLSPRIDEDESSVFLLYFRISAGRPDRACISRAARIIARSEIRQKGEGRDPEVAITGSRALAYPEIAPHGSDAVPFLVSRRIWFNRNRSVTAFPSTTAHLGLVLDDINARLAAAGIAGSVSTPR